MDRELAWAGVCNARDLGGLRLEDGGVTRSRRLVRSGHLDRLSVDGWRELRRWGIRTVVDLRNERERSTQVDEALSIRRLSRPVEDPADDIYFARYGDLLAHPEAIPGSVEHFPDLFRGAITSIATSPRPVLFHCAAGRDRTGWIAVLLLRLAGVVIDDIVDDDERAVRIFAGWQREQPERHGERLRSPAELDAAVGDRRRALADWLGATDVERLCRERLRLPAAVIDAVRAGLRAT